MLLSKRKIGIKEWGIFNLFIFINLFNNVIFMFNIYFNFNMLKI